MVRNINCSIESDCILLAYHTDLCPSIRDIQKIYGIDGYIEWQKYIIDHSKEQIKICIGFAANSLLLYHEAEKRFIEEGGQSLDKISKVYGREILK